MSKLRWTLRAQSDLLEIARFIARDKHRQDRPTVHDRASAYLP